MSVPPFNMHVKNQNDHYLLFSIDDGETQETNIGSCGEVYMMDLMRRKRSFKVRLYLHVLIKFYMGSKSTKCKLAVVEAMSNLLKSNACIAFSICQHEATYNDVDEIRTIFLQALQLGLASHAEFGSTQSMRVENYTSNLKKLQMALISDINSPSILSCLIDVCEAQYYDEIISCLLGAYNEKGLLRLLRLTLSEEFKYVRSLNTLFRTDSFVTRFISTLLNIHGRDYLIESLRTIMNEVHICLIFWPSNIVINIMVFCDFTFPRLFHLTSIWKLFLRNLLRTEWTP